MKNPQKPSVFGDFMSELRQAQELAYRGNMGAGPVLAILALALTELDWRA